MSYCDVHPSPLTCAVLPGSFWQMAWGPKALRQSTTQTFPWNFVCNTDLLCQHNVESEERPGLTAGILQVDSYGAKHAKVPSLWRKTCLPSFLPEICTGGVKRETCASFGHAFAACIAPRICLLIVPQIFSLFTSLRAITRSNAWLRARSLGCVHVVPVISMLFAARCSHISS